MGCPRGAMFAMVLVQVAYAIVNQLYTLALVVDDRMSLKILVAYRLMFAAATTLPIALVFECRKSIGKITWMVMLQTTGCALLGAFFYQNMYSASLAMTSATLASAMSNLVPAITIVLSISLRLEKLEMGSNRGKGKVFGTLVGICGAMVLIFYVGVEINIWHALTDFIYGQTSGLHHHHQVLGIILAVFCPFFAAFSLIIQGNLSNTYDYPCTTTTLVNLMASVLSVIYALCADTDRTQWRLGLDIRLLTAAFSGIFASGIAMILIIWYVKLNGPLFIALFNPLTTILTAIAGSLALGQKLHLGSIIGFILIVSGHFAVLWGKGNEVTEITNTIDMLVHSEEATEMVSTIEPIHPATTTEMLTSKPSGDSSVIIRIDSPTY